MSRESHARFCQCLLGTWVILATLGGTVRADDAEELRKQVEQLSRRIEELERQLADTQPSTEEIEDRSPPAAAKRYVIDPAILQKLAADYLKENPGAGMPPGVQTGYFAGQGFVVRSPPTPTYTNWQDECPIPFTLHIRGLAQFGYDFYKVTDKLDHLTSQLVAVPTGDFSQLEVKRARLDFFGTAFTPDLRYEIEFDGSTLGLPGLNNVGTPNPAPMVAGNIPGAQSVTVGHAVQLYTAVVAYDWRPCGANAGEQDAPTVTLVVGKYRPFFAFEQYLGDGTQQLVEHGMATWFFDADDDTQQTQVGVQLRAIEERLFATINVANGNESQTPNVMLDRLPGINGGFWCDLGGNWNEERRRWELYGSTVSDLDYSCDPVLRAGLMFNLVPMDRRSIYGNAEQDRVQALPGAPGGTSFISFFNSGTLRNGMLGPFAMDSFDSFFGEAFVAAKWRGFSILNDWWMRDLQDYRAATTSGPGGPIVYSVPQPDGTQVGNFLFPQRPVHDYGMMLQGGFFLIPKKLEVAGRWSWLRGQSGDVFGTGRVVRTVVLNGTNVVELSDAFGRYHEADEYTIGVNYYWHGEQLKWQTDFSIYQGGNPATGGRPLAGFLPGVDGWLLRTQIQLWF
jgi:hypothetical protein